MLLYIKIKEHNDMIFRDKISNKIQKSDKALEKNLTQFIT